MCCSLLSQSVKVASQCLASTHVYPSAGSVSLSGSSRFTLSDSAVSSLKDTYVEELETIFLAHEQPLLPRYSSPQVAAKASIL